MLLKHTKTIGFHDDQFPSLCIVCLQFQPVAVTSALQTTAAAVRSASTPATATTAPAVLDIVLLPLAPPVHLVRSFAYSLSVAENACL